MSKNDDVVHGDCRQESSGLTRSARRRRRRMKSKESGGAVVKTPCSRLGEGVTHEAVGDHFFFDDQPSAAGP